MFYLWPIDRCSNSRTALCWQSARWVHFFIFTLHHHILCSFSSRKPGDSYPKIDRSRRTLAKNDLPSSGADVWIPREMGFPYIYIYCISISRVFWRFLTFFARFWILSIFCALYPCFLTFFAGSFFPLWYGHFLTFLKSVPFKEMGFGFYRFFIFLGFFTFFGSFFFGFIFYRFFIVFLPFFEILFFERFLSNVASVGRFLFCEKPEKVEKSRKNDVFWGPKKRVKVGPFCTTPIFGQKSCFLAS